MSLSVISGINRVIHGVNRLINGLTRFINCISRSIHGITRLMNGWAGGPGAAQLGYIWGFRGAAPPAYRYRADCRVKNSTVGGVRVEDYII